MHLRLIFKSLLLSVIANIIYSALSAQVNNAAAQPASNSDGNMIILISIAIILLAAAIFLKIKISKIVSASRKKKQEADKDRLNQYVSNMDSKQIEEFIQYKQKKNNNNKPKDNGFNSKLMGFFLVLLFSLNNQSLFAQSGEKGSGFPFSDTGVIITIILILLPILTGIILIIVKVKNILRQSNNKKKIEEAEKLANYLKSLPDDEIEDVMMKRKAELDYRLSNIELSGQLKAEDSKGLININTNSSLPVFAIKKKAVKRPNIDPQLSKLILWYIGCATFWLLFGTTVGEYLGIKFVAPDADHISWLSFGRLRPVHTNAVFWGWASLGMLGLGLLYSAHGK